MLFGFKGFGTTTGGPSISASNAAEQSLHSSGFVALTGLVSYGGDPSIVASRAEIERISGTLGVVQQRLIDELQPIAQLNGVIQHLQFDVELPETLVRLGLQRHGCFIASESYFTTDARISHQLNGITEFLATNPWAAKLIPKEAWLTAAAVTVLGAATDSPVTAHAVRTGMAQIDSDQLPLLTSPLPNKNIVIESKQAKLQSTPTNLQQLTSRLIDKSGNIRIEGYQTENGRVLVVYLPGTANWNPVGNGSAFDVESNLELIGDQDNSNSVRAAKAAISEYGVKPTDSLILVGYSQGGMIAAELAEAGSNISGVVTIGSPIAKSSFDSDLPVVSLEHSNDIVPALTGATNPITENWSTATRHLELNFGQNISEAHDIENYVETAKMADESTDNGLNRVKNRIMDQLEGAKPLETREFSASKEASKP